MDQTNREQDASVPVLEMDAATESRQNLSLIDVDIEPLASIDTIQPLTPTKTTDTQTTISHSKATDKPPTVPEHDNNDEACDRTDSIASDSTIQPDNDPHEEINRLKIEKKRLNEMILEMQTKLDCSKADLEREVQKRVDLEQRFTEEAKRTTDQIEELIAKSDSDDTKLAELKKKFDSYTRETSSMIENFTTNRELLASQLIELRNENNYLLGKYLCKARDLQNAEIDLPQSVEELQFHCLTLNEKLILATLAKESLEETLAQTSTTSRLPSIETATSQT